MTKTYPFEGKLYVESGENRLPKFGEVCLCDGVVTRCTNPNCDKAYPILTPAPSPRILNGYCDDAKAGDVYQCPFALTLWELVEQREPKQGDKFIAMYGEQWRSVAGFFDHGGGPRWIVEPYVEASPAPAVAERTADMVNNPPHYRQGGIETIDMIQFNLTSDEFRGFLRGNALKYRMRAGYKGDAAEDIAKAKYYEAKLKSVLEPQTEGSGPDGK